MDWPRYFFFGKGRKSEANCLLIFVDKFPGGVSNNIAVYFSKTILHLEFFVYIIVFLIKVSTKIFQLVPYSILRFSKFKEQYNQLVCLP